MPIIAHEGNMLDLPSGILVHGCNAQGVMGSGIALQIKEKYPEAFERYMRVASDPSFKKNRGMLLGTTPWIEVSKDLYIVNAITQEKYGNDGKKYVNEKAVEDAFRFVKALAESRKLPVHFPMIGCGRGGGNWEDIASRIERALGSRITGHLWVLPGSSQLEVNPYFKTQLPV